MSGGDSTRENLLQKWNSSAPQPRSPSLTSVSMSSFAGHHAWRLPVLVPKDGLRFTRSTASLRSTSSHKSGHRACGPLDAAAGGFSTPFQSAALRCELWLRERLQTSDASAATKESRHTRAMAVLEALQEASQMVSPTSSILPLLARELIPLALSDRIGGGLGGPGPGGASRLFHFEVVGELGAELTQRDAALREMGAEIRQQVESRRQVEAVAERLQERLLDAEKLQERLQARLSAHGKEMGCEVRKLEMLQEELDALDRRLVRADELRLAKEEMLRHAQVELYRERTCVAEQAAMLKELQERSVAMEREQRVQLKFYEQALAHALQAHRTALGEPMPPDWTELRGSAARSQASARQVEAGLHWAEELMGDVRPGGEFSAPRPNMDVASRVQKRVETQARSSAGS